MRPTLPAMRLHRDQAKTLQILLDADRAMLPFEIGKIDGRYANGNIRTWSELGRHLVYHLVRYRAVDRAGRAPLRFEITERGRIALAIWRFKEDRRARHAVQVR